MQSLLKKTPERTLSLMAMRGRRLRSGLAFMFFSLLLLGGCAQQPSTLRVPEKEGKKIVNMTASNFKFEPNVIKASPGDVLVLEIENISGTDHNFTIKNPQEDVLGRIDLPEKSTRQLTIQLPGSGIYPFYCDKPFHSTLGMEGRIEVK